MNRWALRMRGAQHKRPGATARRERQQAALERLWESKKVQTDRVQHEIATLKRRLRITGDGNEEV